MLALSGLTDSGALTPALAGVPVSIVYSPPSGSEITHTETTDAAGGFADTLRARLPGVWHVQAHWAGDGQYLPADSPICTLSIGADAAGGG